MALEGGRERLYVRGGGGEEAVQAQLEAVAVAADPLSDRVVDRRHRRGRVLRVGGQDRHAAHSLGVQAVQDRADRGLAVAHRDLDAHARQALAEEAGLLAGVVHEGRALLQPDAAVLAGDLARTHAQNDALEDRLPQERAHLDDAAVGEELAQEGADGTGFGRGRRPQVHQDEGGAGFAGLRFAGVRCAGLRCAGLRCAGLRADRGRGASCYVLGVRHATSLMFAFCHVADAVSPPGTCSRCLQRPGLIRLG